LEELEEKGSQKQEHKKSFPQHLTRTPEMNQDFYNFIETTVDIIEKKEINPNKFDKIL